MNIDFESRVENELADIKDTLQTILALMTEKQAAPRKPKLNLTTAEFERFWGIYPKKIGKKKCLSLWMNGDFKHQVNFLVGDVRTRLEQDQQWIDGYAPNPQTYLNGERWNDDITPIKQEVEALPRNDDDLWNWAKEHGYPNPGSMTYRQYRHKLQTIHTNGAQ